MDEFMIYSLNDQYYVRSLQASDLDGSYPSWFEDQLVCRFNSHGKFFRGRAYFQQYLDSLNSDNKVVWAICHCTDGHIGNISLQDISLIDRNAELAIIIGNRNHFGKGVGKQAATRLIQHGFYKLNLEKVHCGTADSNIAMKRLALSLGMVEEGRRRNHLFLDGEWVDLVEYGLLRVESSIQKPTYK